MAGVLGSNAYLFTHSCAHSFTFQYVFTECMLLKVQDGVRAMSVDFRIRILVFSPCCGSYSCSTLETPPNFSKYPVAS